MNDTQPQFGAVDIVEAFTALRHEYRGQAKESRNLVEQMQVAVQRMEQLAAQVVAKDRSGADDNQELKPMVRLLVDTDQQLARVLRAVEQAEAARKVSGRANRDSLEMRFQRLSRLGRWFARPLLDESLQQLSRHDASQSALLEGMSLTISRLRSSMNELGIQVVEVEGLPFDGTTMHAVGTVSSGDVPPGHVAEQISPCYLWKSSVLRFADVRVAEQIP